jgi:hypothetical protein
VSFFRHRECILNAIEIEIKGIDLDIWKIKISSQKEILQMEVSVIIPNNLLKILNLLKPFFSLFLGCSNQRMQGERYFTSGCGGYTRTCSSCKY